MTLGRRLVDQILVTKNFGCHPKSSRRPWEGWVGQIASHFCFAAPHLGSTSVVVGWLPGLARSSLEGDGDGENGWIKRWQKQQTGQGWGEEMPWHLGYIMMMKLENDKGQEVGYRLLDNF